MHAYRVSIDRSYNWLAEFGDDIPVGEKVGRVGFRD